MMRCDEVQTWFADYLGQALPAPERCELEDHLILCPSCKLALDAERRLDQLLAAQPLTAPPPDFTRQVLARIQRERVQAPSLGQWLLDGLPYAASAAALLVGINRVLSALPAREREALAPSLWGKVQALMLQGFDALSTLGGQANTVVPSDLLPGIGPLGALGVLALLALTLALYLSLAEEH